MMAGMGTEADDRIVVGYFADSADADRAIEELIDEGFRASEIGAAYRSPRRGLEQAESGRPMLGARENPETSGSIGGAESHDEAVTPAGLAPGSGNAFPAPAKPGLIPGGELPSTLRSTLKHDLPERTPVDRMPLAEASREEGRRDELNAEASEEARRGKRRKMLGGEGRGSSMKFGTGEGRLFDERDFSEISFENSFVGMGLGAREARGLSAEMRSGGAVVSVSPGSRASLAEGILERNHGRIRFETVPSTAAPSEDPRVEIYGRMHNYYRPEERRKAS